MKNAGLADHKTVHSKLEKFEKGAKDADVKALAAKMKPTVEQHLKSAQMITAAK
jgi:putative membrane protein